MDRFFRFGKLCRCGKTTGSNFAEPDLVNEEEREKLKVKFNNEQSV